MSITRLIGVRIILQGVATGAAVFGVMIGAAKNIWKWLIATAKEIEKDLRNKAIVDFVIGATIAIVIFAIY